MFNKIISIIIFLLLLNWGIASAAGFSEDFSGKIDSKGIPAGWNTLEFKKVKRHTRYTVVKEGDNYFLKARADNSASGIYRELTLDPKKYRILSWRWRVENILKKGDAHTKKGDDYAARIYISFKYEPAKASFWKRTKYRLIKKLYGKYPPEAVINYVWANKLRKGEVVNSAYGGEMAKVVAVESGKQELSKWKKEQRDIYQDYLGFFGKQLPPISGIAIMTDSDNTKEAATAYYDDLVLSLSSRK